MCDGLFLITIIFFFFSEASCIIDRLIFGLIIIKFTILFYISTGEIHLDLSLPDLIIKT